MTNGRATPLCLVTSGALGVLGCCWLTNARRATPEQISGEKNIPLALRNSYVWDRFLKILVYFSTTAKNGGGEGGGLV